jgi:hypothetical protein
MIRNETTAAPQSVNLFPVTALAFLTLLGVIAGLVMLFGLHNKIQKSPEMETIVVADEIGEIKLDQDMVRINLMKRTASGSVEKLQEVELPLEKFAAGYPRLQSFMDQMIEKGIISEQ